MNDAAKLKELMTPAKMNGAVYDNLFQLARWGAREVGEIPSKGHMQELVQNKWVRFNGDEEKCWTITDAGLQAFLEAYSKIPNPHYKIFGTLRIGFAERCGNGELDGTPIHCLGGCFDWARENVFLNKVLNWAESFGSYDYATFDFIHPVTKVKTHLKPGDWVVLSEDHNHTVHKLSEDN
jgi:hypothetical protein